MATGVKSDHWQGVVCSLFTAFQINNKNCVLHSLQSPSSSLFFSLLPAFMPNTVLLFCWSQEGASPSAEVDAVGQVSVLVMGEWHGKPPRMPTDRQKENGEGEKDGGLWWKVAWMAGSDGWKCGWWWKWKGWSQKKNRRLPYCYPCSVSTVRHFDWTL